MLFFGLSLITLFILVYGNPLSYCISLAVSILLVFGYLTYLSVIPTLFALSIVLVYISASIVLFAYVCAVTPNLSTYTPTTLKSTGLLGAVALLIYMGYSSDFQPNYPIHRITPDHFLYSTHGLLFFLLLTLVIAVILIILSNNSKVSSPFRS